MTNPADDLRALSFHFDDMPVLRPGLDYHGGYLYVTIPMDRDQPRKVGRGAHQKEVIDRVTATVAVRSAGPEIPTPVVFPYDEDGVKAAGFRFPQTFTQAETSRWPMASLDRYLNGTAKIVDPKALFERIREAYRTYVEFPAPVYYDVVPLFLMTSYVFRMFGSTGYIHFNGTMASGKSQNLRLLEALGFNAMWASSMTQASMFRQVAGCPGLICVDEAERFDSEKGQDLRQIILAGYSDGSRATRAERGANERWVTVRYDVYCPKVLASINPLDPTMSSRCLIIPMQRALRNIPDLDIDSPVWADIRGELYTWALQWHPAIRRIRDDWRATRAERVPKLKSRNWEIAQSYVTMAEHVGGEGLADSIATFFVEYFASAAKSSEDQDKQYTLLKCLPRMLQSTFPHPGFYYSVKDIHMVVSSYLEEDAREYYKSRTTGRHLKTLGFRDSRAAKGGQQVYIPEAQVREAMDRHNVTAFDEDIPWRREETSYQITSGFKPPEEPEQKGFDFLDGYVQ
jgi:hypothetical protein